MTSADPAAPMAAVAVIACIAVTQRTQRKPGPAAVDTLADNGYLLDNR
jgi:hypothetical protein